MSSTTHRGCVKIALRSRRLPFHVLNQVQLPRKMLQRCFAVKLQKCFVGYNFVLHLTLFTSRWGWEDDDWISICGWTVPLKIFESVSLGAFSLSTQRWSAHGAPAEQENHVLFTLICHNDSCVNFKMNTLGRRDIFSPSAGIAHIFKSWHKSSLFYSWSVCILVRILSLPSASNSLVATTSLHNHEPREPQRLLHLADIYHYYFHSCLPFIWQCFGGVYTFSPPITISLSILDKAEL